MFGYSPPPENPMIEARFTMAPPRFDTSIWRAAAREQRNTAVWLTAITVSHSVLESSIVGLRIEAPALLARMSVRPVGAARSAKKGSIPASGLASSRKGSALPDAQA